MHSSNVMHLYKTDESKTEVEFGDEDDIFCECPECFGTDFNVLTSGEIICADLECPGMLAVVEFED